LAPIIGQPIIGQSIIGAPLIEFQGHPSKVNPKWFFGVFSVCVTLQLHTESLEYGLMILLFKVLLCSHFGSNKLTWVGG